MEEELKNRIVIILAVLFAVFFFGTLSSCNNARHQQAAYEKERATRIQLEEKEGRFLQEKTALEEKAKTKEKEAEEAKAALEATKKILVQEQLVNQSLKEELQKTAQPKTASGNFKGK